jgi:flagellar biosynthesis chaperone FliJ
MSALDRQIQEETLALRNAQVPGIIDLQQTIRHRHWLGHLHKNALEAEARHRFLEARLSQERNLLAEAVKQRRILEKLRDRQQEKHTQDEERQTTKAFDEMSTLRYVFNKTESALSH